PFPAGADLTKRIPWANEPKCQSCHTGDAVSNLGLTDPNVIKSSDGIRLLQAYRTNDTANAVPILATNKRFAEETANGNTVLYRLSKGHSGVSCEACHGSTHAEWPVKPESGTAIANDNVAAMQLQGHTGKIIECAACHTSGSLPVTLNGPHGMHPVGDSRFISGHDNLFGANRAQCQACHGQTGQGTVLSKVAVNRTVGSRTFTKDEMIACTRCHDNPM
ncbi:MAG TPA: cytochrome C, partial [Syntrophobacteraceae bacterium]|nr:cytochrome C [Syntrophobacteraceae bacterium]